jgi:hypothetical protein
MHFPSLSVLTLLALSSSLASAGLTTICTHLKTANHGCERNVKGYDITGVLTEVDLTFPAIKTACDCIQACLDRPTTCASYVWKFTTPASVLAGHRTCTLYSDFNLPSAVTVEVALGSVNNANLNEQAIIANGNNPHHGALVPQAFKDNSLNMVADKDAVSG